VAVWSAQHSHLDALATQSGDAARPFSLDGHTTFEIKAELGEELNRGIEVFHHDAYIMHQRQFGYFHSLWDSFLRLTSKMSHDGSWRAACNNTIHFLWFHFETPSVARSVTDPGVGSGALLDAFSGFRITVQIATTKLWRWLGFHSFGTILS
jgi:hypothetical protein